MAKVVITAKAAITAKAGARASLGTLAQSPSAKVTFTVVGQEPGSRATRAFHRERKGRDARGRGHAEHPPVEGRRVGHYSAEPEEAVGMHERRGVGPNCVIEPMGQDGQGLQELGLEIRVGPPGEEPNVDELAGPSPPRKNRNISEGVPSRSRSRDLPSRIVRW